MSLSPVVWSFVTTIKFFDPLSLSHTWPLILGVRRDNVFFSTNLYPQSLQRYLCWVVIWLNLKPSFQILVLEQDGHWIKIDLCSSFSKARTNLMECFHGYLFGCETRGNFVSTFVFGFMMFFSSFLWGVIFVFLGSFWFWYVILGCFSVLFYCYAQHVYATFLWWLLTSFLGCFSDLYLIYFSGWLCSFHWNYWWCW